MVTTTRSNRNGINRSSGCGSWSTRDPGALGAFSLVRDEKAFATALVDFCRIGGPGARGWLTIVIGTGFVPSARAN